MSSGDYLPGLPKHNLKLGLHWNLNERLRVGTSVLAYSSQYVRGNENNRHQPNDEVEGSGKLPGYAVVNLTADYRFARDWTLFGRVDNLFDKRYYASSYNELWVAPGAERQVTLAATYKF